MTPEELRALRRLIEGTFQEVWKELPLHRRAQMMSAGFSIDPVLMRIDALLGAETGTEKEQTPNERRECSQCQTSWQGPGQQPTRCPRCGAPAQTAAKSTAGLRIDRGISSDAGRLGDADVPAMAHGGARVCADGRTVPDIAEDSGRAEREEWDHIAQALDYHDDLTYQDPQWAMIQQIARESLASLRVRVSDCPQCAEMQRAVTQMARENRSLEKRLNAADAPRKDAP